MKRFAVFIYGALSYAVFLGVFLYGVGFIGGFGTPTSLDGAPRHPLGVALAINVALLAVFALQHSGMARPAFKRWWTRAVPAAAERSTYVLASSLALVALYILWQPMGGVLWDVSDGFARKAIFGVYLAGWTLLFYATLLIDHFELFGLAQIWRNLRGRTEPAARFKTPGLYRHVRHPIYVGWLVIFWAAPTMTVAHLLFALGTTAYILIALRLEERDLIDTFGSDYVEYRRSTPALVPRFGRARQPLRTVRGDVTRALCLVLLLAAAAHQANAATSHDAIATVTVRYTDLDTRRTEGARVLYTRIRAAVTRVCQEDSAPNLATHTRFRKCYRAKLDEAVTAAKQPLVSALHASRTL